MLPGWNESNKILKDNQEHVKCQGVFEFKQREDTVLTPITLNKLLSKQYWFLLFLHTFSL